MGFLKKIKKAVKKTISNPVNVVKKVASGDIKGAVKDAAMGPVNDVKDSIDIAKSAVKGVVKAVSPSTPDVATASDPGIINAADVQNPDDAKADEDTGGDTASEVKKNRATGKKSLTVARTSGGGVNI